MRLPGPFKGVASAPHHDEPKRLLGDQVEAAPGYWFTSSLFGVDSGEDEETNPRLYGRQPAQWLRQKLLARGYDVEEVIPEDWGWCVMCQRDPYRLWVACVNLRDYEYAKEGDPPLSKEWLLWNAVPMAEVPALKYLFRRKPDVASGLAKLEEDLLAVLKSESQIQIVDEEVPQSWFLRRNKSA